MDGGDRGRDYIREVDYLERRVKELSKRVPEEDILKFYYCESEDEYYVGRGLDTMYYAKVNPKTFDKYFCMSRYLPWGKHVVDDNTLWKEHTYPSEPKEIDFSEWLKGWIEKNNFKQC